MRHPSLERFDPSIQQPKFHVAVANKLFGEPNGLGLIAAPKFDAILHVAVRP
jgi:hypothetical protein